MTNERTDPPITPERLAELAGLAMQLAAADAYARLWGRVYADYKARRAASRQ